jgi:uncharacterized protein YjgD (DUF1641 family)
MKKLEQTPTLSDEEIRTLKDFLNLGRALTSSLTPSQITSLASGLGEIFPLLQTLSDPGIRKLIGALSESSGALGDLVELVATYQQSGAIRNAFEAVTLLRVVRDSLSASAVTQLAEIANNLLATGDGLVSEMGGIEGIQCLIESAKEACKEAEKDKSTIGVTGLLKVLKEPAVQKGIKFLLHFSRKIDKK